jgi:hypothetical protein
MLSFFFEPLQYIYKYCLMKKKDRGQLTGMNTFSGFGIGQEFKPFIHLKFSLF